MNFNDFCKREEKKMVNHFVKYCNRMNRPPTTSEAFEIFGISELECQAIVAKTIVKLATKQRGV